jgi:hypothetical protein
MLKFGSVLALACTLALPAHAQGMQSQGQAVKLVEYSSPMLPPANYKGQWWTSPDNCRYSRAGRPGETVWYLIVNSAHMKCQVRLIQRAYSDYN